MSEEELPDSFSVTQFFPDGSYETVAEDIPAKQAVEVASQLIHSLGGRMGTTVRVIITDVGDCINFEWKYGEGVIFPPLPEPQS